MSAGRVVHCWARNAAGEEIRASVSTFEGRRYDDLRIYWSDDAGERHPTKKGVTIAVEQLAELEEAVRRLRAAVAELPAEQADRYTRSARLRESRD
jgi:Transcriptional Coactivator p15 (PC4)